MALTKGGQSCVTAKEKTDMVHTGWCVKGAQLMDLVTGHLTNGKEKGWTRDF